MRDPRYVYPEDEHLGARLRQDLEGRPNTSSELCRDHLGPLPQRETADFHDFMYYAFTIALCYSTSDISVTSARIRRVTLLHAIFSFLFVTAIIGFVVNITPNVI